MAPAPTPSKAGGSVLTRKFGPLPGWAWAGLGVAGFFIYKQRKAAAAAAAGTSSTTATPSASLPTSAVTAPSGYGYQGPGVGGGGGSGPSWWGTGTPTGATGGVTSPAVVTAPNTRPADTGPSTTLQGSGYTSPGLVTGTGGGQYEGVPTPQAAQGILGSGGSLYYMSSPGVFTPTTGAGLAPNTELFQKTS